MALVDTPLQRRLGIRDSAALALADWCSLAQFDCRDLWPRRWAEHYVERCTPDVYEWLRGHGVRFIPAVQWVERGLMRPGNSLPRYHVIWGASQRMARLLLEALERHPQRAKLQILLRHRVGALLRSGSAVSGCTGIDEASGAEFSVAAEQTVVAAGGITGDLARVRQHWPREWGAAPAVLLNGSHPHADGRLHDAVARIGGKLTHLEQMWNYAAGVHHPNPQFDGHGLSLIPVKSALWLDPDGRRIGPVPLVTGFDTREMVAQIAHNQWPYTWQVLNRKIAIRELAASGAEHNPAIRDRRLLAFIRQMLRGNPQLVDELLARCPDFVQAPTLPELAQKMNALAGDQRLVGRHAGAGNRAVRRADAARQALSQRRPVAPHRATAAVERRPHAHLQFPADPRPGGRPADRDPLPHPDPQIDRRHPDRSRQPRAGRRTASRSPACMRWAKRPASAAAAAAGAARWKAPSCPAAS